MNRLAEILALLNDADTLADDDIALLEAELLTLFDDIRNGSVDDVPADDVATLRQVAEAVEQTRTLAADRIAAADARQAEIAELEAVLRPADEPAVVDEPAVEMAADVEPEPEVEAEPVVEPEPVAAAARPALTQVRAAAPTPAVRVRERARLARISTPDGPVDDMAGVARAMAQRFNDLRGPARHFEKVRVARIDAAYPSDRVLTGDQTADLDRIEALVAAVHQPDYWTDALVASGGFCADPDVGYDVAYIGSTSRPVRDGLPGFQATRGCVNLPAALTLADIDIAGADAAVSVWTQADDEGGEASKPYQEVACVTFTEYCTQAIVRRLRFGNFGARAFPEQMEAYQDLTLVAHARMGEGELLDAIVNASTAVTTAQVFGASRDLAEAIIRAAFGYRSRHRLDAGYRLRAALPYWVPALGGVDLLRGTDSRDVLTAGQDVFRGMLADAGVNVTFYNDTPSTGTSQVFGAQGAGALNAWPGAVQWGLWDEGHHLFLDGGTLDLGIVRDSTLNDTNDFETFAETFEGVASRGVESLWVTSTVCPDGTYADQIDGTVCGS